MQHCMGARCGASCWPASGHKPTGRWAVSCYFSAGRDGRQLLDRNVMLCWCAAPMQASPAAGASCGEAGPRRQHRSQILATSDYAYCSIQPFPTAGASCAQEGARRRQHRSSGSCCRGCPAARTAGTCSSSGSKPATSGSGCGNGSGNGTGTGSGGSGTSTGSSGAARGISGVSAAEAAAAGCLVVPTATPAASTAAAAAAACPATTAAGASAAPQPSGSPARHNCAAQRRPRCRCAPTSCGGIPSIAGCHPASRSCSTSAGRCRSCRPVRNASSGGHAGGDGLCALQR